MISEEPDFPPRERDPTNGPRCRQEGNREQMVRKLAVSLAVVAALALAAGSWAAPAPKVAAKKDKLATPASLTEKAPDKFKVRFETTKGNVVIEVTRSWAPNGADRFYNLVRNGYYDGCRFFRVVSGFMVQFGINGDPALNKVWREARIQDDPVTQSNTRGMVTFATAGPNTRTSQVFINFADRNAFLDGQGFSPFGKIVEGMDVVDKFNAEYGEGAPMGKGPEQDRIQKEGNAYLEASFPNLDWIKAAIVVGDDAKKADSKKPVEKGPAK
jgi:peptidyl-prolyl cis-trans isomerase A (cyclophilin A)